MRYNIDMAEVKGQQSFQLPPNAGVTERTRVEEVKRDSRDRILPTRSPVYKTPNDDEKVFGIVSGKSGCWVRPIGSSQDLVHIETLEDINLAAPDKQLFIVELGTLLYTPRNRLVNPNAPKKSPRGNR
jgi:hypothetical protein